MTDAQLIHDVFEYGQPGTEAECIQRGWSWWDDLDVNAAIDDWNDKYATEFARLTSEALADMVVYGTDPRETVQRLTN